MTDREKVIKGINICLQRFHRAEDCPYYDDCGIGCMEQLREDVFDLLKEHEGYVSVPFLWLVKFCTHIDFKEPMSDQERELLWRKKLCQQFGIRITSGEECEV